MYIVHNFLKDLSTLLSHSWKKKKIRPLFKTWLAEESYEFEPSAHQNMINKIHNLLF